MWVVGQRVIAEFEPELGLGAVRAVIGPRQIEVYFPGADMVRRYAQAGAPLRRLVLAQGQKFRTLDGQTHVVTHSREQGGLLHFTTQDGETIPETKVEGILTDETPLSRLLTSTWDAPKSFDLRRKAWMFRAETLDPDLRGLIGPRVALLPHQLGIARDVARREFPRVLLSDEVGLGKTIEAGLIFSSLRALGRAERVLVLVPEGLQNQWLAELYRRFNEMFSIVDEERSEQEELSQESSAFAMNQRIICSLSFFKNNTERLQEAVEEEWDLLIVDEAHRMHWSEDEPSLEWDIVRLLSERSRGLLLLTATPRSQGLTTQYGLLNLVDPDRFHSFEEFQADASRFGEVAALAKQVEQGQRDPALKKQMKAHFKEDGDLLKTVDSYLAGESGEPLLQKLIDRHGTGRVLFRNRRARIKGFPRRKLIRHPFVTTTAKSDLFEARANQVLQIIDSDKDKKFLLICTKPQTVRKLQEWLRVRSSARTAIFDEDLEIVERDRQAAWFAEATGARILLCSEIGGEGRNFQFCHNLILFDLPTNPDVVEQRIGRLDRIGQTQEVRIHVPFVDDSPESALLEYYEQVLMLFSEPWPGLMLGEAGENALAKTLEAFVPKAAKYKDRKKVLKNFLEVQTALIEELRAEQERGVDVLLDIHSFSAGKGLELSKRIKGVDESASLRNLLEEVFEFFGVDSEKIDERGTYRIAMHSLTFVESFPGLSQSGELVATYDRQRALEQEELTFLSREHAIFLGALSLVLEGNIGKVSAGFFEPEDIPGERLLFEAIYVVESTAPPYLEVQRDLPTQVIHVVFNSTGKLVSLPRRVDAADLKPLSAQEQRAILLALKDDVANSFEKISKQVQKTAAGLVDKAIVSWKQRAENELARLKEIAKVNPLISDEEMDAEAANKEEGIIALKTTVPRLDAIRILIAKPR